MAAWTVRSGSWAAAAAGDVAIAHGLTGAGAGAGRSIVAVLVCTTNVDTTTTPPNGTNFFVSRTATTSGSVIALVGLGVRSGQY